MNIRKSVFTFCLLTTVLAIPSFTPASAAPSQAAVTAQPATKIKLTPAERANLLSFWDNYGVKPSTQQKLLSQFTAGVPFEAANPKARPVSTNAEISGSTKTVISTYSDGSITVLTQQLPTSDSSHPADVVMNPTVVVTPSGCASTGSSTYHFRATGCKASWSSGVYGWTITYNYETYNGGSRTVTGLGWGFSTWAAGGSWSDKHIWDSPSTSVHWTASLTYPNKAYADMCASVSAYGNTSVDVRNPC